MNRTTNTFTGGMQQDVDPHLTQNNKYRYALNGRIMYNRINGTIVPTDQNGGTLAFATMRGNKEVFSTCTGYTIIGHCDMEDQCVLFSTDTVNSEIGVFTYDPVNQTGQYQTIFNDALDPNGELLGFAQESFLLTVGEIENSERKRVYWTYGTVKHEPMVINIALATPYNCGDAPEAYPWWFSVHSFKLRTDVRFSMPKYKKTLDNETGANLKTGAYQYCYRYVTRDGHKTVWSPVCNHVLMPAKTMTEIIANGESQHKYVMSPSNITTNKAIAWTIDDVDSRYWKLEVAFLYWIDDKTPSEFTVFEEKSLEGLSGSIDIRHLYHSGYGVSFDELGQRYTNVVDAKTIAIHKSKLWLGNVTVDPPLIFDASTATIEQNVKEMYSDIKIYPDFDATGEPLTDADYDNNTLQTQAYVDNSSTPVYNTYSGGNQEYRNYKGSLWNFLYKSYWRGETYPFAVVLRDMKGQPSFVNPIQDYTFGEQWDTTNGVPITDNDGTNWYILLLGLKVNGINIPHSVLYDDDGNLKVSSMEIVRTRRIKRIQHQGVVTPCIFHDNNTYALGYPHNVFDPAAGNNPQYKSPTYAYSGNNSIFQQRHATFTYSSPDVEVEEKIIQLQENHAMRYVGVAKIAYTTDPAFDARWGVNIVAAPQNHHLYGKFYDMNNGRGSMLPVNNSRLLNTVCQNKSYNTADPIPDYNPENLQLDFQIGTDSRWDTPFSGDVQWSNSHINSVLSISRDWNRTDEGVYSGSTPDEDWFRYRIVNYVTPIDKYYSPDSSQETRIFQSTGHFQAINAAVLATLPTGTVNGETTYIFNGVEVWGGDCFPDFWDFVKNYPRYNDCNTDGGGNYNDSSVSMIVPIESNYNMSMRYGRRFAEVAIQPESNACSGDNTFYDKGIMMLQPEDWNVNAVCQAQPLFPQYLPKPLDTVIITDMQSRIVYGANKTYGEYVDSHRRLLINNFGDLEGIYGKVTQFVVLGDNLLAFQERAFGNLLINMRTALSGTDGSAVYTGKGANLDGINYISTKTGTQHPMSVVQTDGRIFWVDARKNYALNQFSQAGLDKKSEDAGQHDFSITTLPIFDLAANVPQAIIGVADEENQEVIMTFKTNIVTEGSPISLIYNYATDSFIGYQTAVTPYWSKFGKYIFAQKSNIESVFVHNVGQYGRFFNDYYDTVLTFVVNPNMTIAKTFDNILVNLRPEGMARIKTISFSTNIVDTQTVTFPDGRYIFKEGLLRGALRGNAIGLERMRGQYCFITITFDNSIQISDEQDIPAVITSVDTLFRPSYKI